MGSQNQGRTVPQISFVPPGLMVDVGGFRLHALLRGQGAPTVILEPALGGFAQQYSQIQPGVAAFTRVLAYDRAGQGWSDASPSPRTPEHLAGEWKALLNRLDLQPPYVLVGHSFGGLLTRVYAGLYPQDVAGIVLVDSTHENEYESFGNIDKNIRQMAGLVRLIKFASRLGLAKPFTKLGLGPEASSFTREDLQTYLALASQPKHYETMLAEFSQHRCFYGARSEVPRTLGDLPLVVVTAGNSVSGKGKIGGMTAEQVNSHHQRLQKALVGLSSRGEQVILPGATHYSIFARPEHAAQIVDSIRHVVEIVRAERV